MENVSREGGDEATVCKSYPVRALTLLVSACCKDVHETRRGPVKYRLPRDTHFPSRCLRLQRSLSGAHTVVSAFCVFDINEVAVVDNAGTIYNCTSILWSASEVGDG